MQLPPEQKYDGCERVPKNGLFEGPGTKARRHWKDRPESEPRSPSGNDSAMPRGAAIAKLIGALLPIHAERVLG